MLTFNTGDISLHIRDEGPPDGRTLVFANSLGTDLRVWESVLPLLPAGLRIVRFDKRGHGLSDATPAPYNITTLISDAEAMCDGLGLKDVTFVGLSIGGLIGQGLASKRPDIVRALVLMDTAAKIGSAEMWRIRIDTVRGQGIAAIADAILERWFTPTFRASDAQLSLWRNMLVRTTVDGYAGCCAAIAGADLTETTRTLKQPVMAMAGDLDSSTPPELVRLTAELCSAAFHEVAAAGHLPCVEQPQATARLLSDFLERTAR
jgi:3-oxoadipate enol-lactonase